MSPSTDDPASAADQALESLRAGIPPLRERNPLVRANLANVVERCLAFDPRYRPATITEVQRALERELRFAPSAQRRVQAKPRKYAVILATTVFACAVSGAYWATRPPRHEVEFTRGQRAYAAGDFVGAVDHYAAAATALPDFLPIEFELARAKLAAGDIDASINLFRALAQSWNHAPSMAYLGYCFNLKEAPTPAVEWYEKAIDHELDSVAVLNNLGASYLISQSRLSKQESINRAEELLQRAIKCDNASNVVRLNLLRLELVKANRDVQYVPASAREHALQLIDGATTDPVIYAVVRGWRDILTHRALASEDIVPPRLQRLPAVQPVAEPERDRAKSRFYIEPGYHVQQFEVARANRGADS
jgi:tetratricopeptide (TPR) repeat protein